MSGDDTRARQRTLRWTRSVAWLALALGACRVGDLVNTPESSPTAPSLLAQRLGGDTTTIAPGAVVHDTVVTFSAMVADPDARDSLRLEVEVEPLGTAFTDSATATSAPAANGSVASVSLSQLADSSYRWQARTLDPAGRASAWVAFGTQASQPDFVMDAVPNPPAIPDSLAQFQSDGTTAIPVGGSTTETTVIFRGILTDPDVGDSLRLQIERQPLGTAFTNVPTATSTAVAQGGAGSVTVTGEVANVDYHWQARTIDRTGLTSAWVSFGGNSENQTDYRVVAPTPPDAPTNMGQYLQNGQVAIPQGGTTTQTTVVFKASLTDPDGDQIQLQVEVQPLGVAFTGTATGSSTFVASGGPKQARVDLSGLTPGTDYHWQARAVDQSGSVSSWVPFGAGATPDFHVQ